MTNCLPAAEIETVALVASPCLKAFASADGRPVDEMHPSKGYKLRAGGEIAGLLALQLLEDGSLKVEKLPGVTDPKSFTGFSDKAKIYVR